MGNLQQDHSYLYKRVRLKAIVHIALGLVLVLLPSAVPGQTNPDQSGLNGTIASTLSYFGGIYLLAGLLITLGIFRPGENYRFLRKALTFAAIYNTLWLIIILIISVQIHFNRSIAYIGVIYAYLTYNIWYVRNDPGWGAIAVVKRITDDQSSNS